MKKILCIILLLPLMLHAQDINHPYVRFDNGVILFYLTSQSAFQLLLPAYKPGFVHILQTPGFQRESNREISENLSSGLRTLGSRIGDPGSTSLIPEQKTGFLENYACLILLNYTTVSDLDSMFYSTAKTLIEDPDAEVKTNAVLVVRMYEMYLQDVKK